VGLRLVAGLATYWWMHGLRADAARSARELLTALGPQVPEGLGEEYLLAVLLAAGSGQDGEFELADHLEQADLVVESQGGLFRHPVTVLLWSVVLGPFQPPGQVADLLARNTASVDPWTLAAIQLCTGSPRLTGTDPERAEKAVQAALAQFRLLGDRWGVSLALSALAELAAWSGQLGLCMELTGQALAVTEELGADEDSALLLCRRADLYLRLGDLSAARPDYQRALQLADGSDTAAAARLGLARAARYAGDLPAAREFAVAAVDGCSEGSELAREEALAELTAIAAAERTPVAPATPGGSRRISGGWLESG
jgi:tetratricopeptide (TPR) repeat protein